MNHRRHEAVVLAMTLAALAGFASSCSDDDLTVATADIVGVWSGTTSQQRPLEFNVESSGVADGQFGYQMTGTCNFTTSQVINAAEGIPVSSGKFTTGKTQIGAGVFITIAGEFTSSTTATGTFLIQHAPCGDTLNISWSATKQ